MKHIFSLTIVCFLFTLVACSPDENGLAGKKIPTWLKDQINADEKTIADNPGLVPNYGAWLQYEFNGRTYFEYDNPLSALSRNPYSWEGIRVDVSQAPYTGYWTGKCCEQYVWKAPKYKKLE